MSEHPTPPGPHGPEHEPVHVLVVHDDKGLAVRINRLLRREQAGTEVYACIDLTRIDEAITDDGPFEVIVAGPAMATGEGLAQLQAIHEADPTTYVVLLFDAEHPDVNLRDVIRTGAEDYLPARSADVEVVDAMRHAVETAAERRDRRALPEPPADEPSPTGAIYTVCSATGGCGKTFFSTNLAYFLAQRSAGRVVLVDLDLQFGEVGPTLRLRPKATISTLLDSDLLEPTPGEVVELGEVEEYLTDTEEGIQVLAAPKDPIEADRVKPREVGKVLSMLAERFDYVVVDTPTGLTELVLAALDLSDRLFVLASLDVMSVRNLRVFLQTLSRLQISSEHVSLILNKEEKGIGIDVEDVERFFDRGFEAILPYSRDVPRSMNSGVPVLAAEPKSRVSRRLARSYEPYLPLELRDPSLPDEDERPGLFERLADLFRR